MSKIKLDQHYVDPRLVELYDIENPRGADTDFYLRLAEEHEAQIILDLGCGTGLLTRELATGNRTVIGVDPAPMMLAFAKRQPGAEKVQWINGSAVDLGNKEADLVIMTGNVAQVFLDEAEWRTTLKAIHKTLKPGGRLAFESRNPAAKAWQQWTPENTLECIDSPFGPIESWLEVIEVGNGTVHFKGINRFKNSGEEVIVDSTLRFRSKTEIANSLKNVGFEVENLYGNWDSDPADEQSRAMIFVARKK